MVQPHTLTLVALSVIFVKVMLAKWEGRGNTIFTCACPGSKETLTTISSMTVRFFKQDWQIMHQSVATTHSINTMVIDTPQYIPTASSLTRRYDTMFAMYHIRSLTIMKSIQSFSILYWLPVYQQWYTHSFNIHNDALTISILQKS